MPDATPAVESERGPQLVRDLVVAADGSEASTEGLRLAADIARRTGAHVSVVHVRHAPGLASLSPAPAGATVQETMDAVQEEVYEGARAILDEVGPSWRFMVREGAPGPEIVAAAKELGADLILIGSRAHSAIHNLVVGSTTEYLVAHSPLRVLVAR
jgi:nucleotide-binding universal stress UspA family protein